MNEHTVFITPSGSAYAVSPRVIANGYEPQDGVRVATRKEREDFLKALTREKGPTKPLDDAAVELLAQGIPAEVIQTLTGIDLSEDG